MPEQFNHFSFDFEREEFFYPDDPEIERLTRIKIKELSSAFAEYDNTAKYMCLARNCDLCKDFAAVTVFTSGDMNDQLCIRDGDGNEQSLSDHLVFKLCAVCSIRMAEAQNTAIKSSLIDEWQPQNN